MLHEGVARTFLAAAKKGRGFTVNFYHQGMIASDNYLQINADYNVDNFKSRLYYNVGWFTVNQMSNYIFYTKKQQTFGECYARKLYVHMLHGKTRLKVLLRNLKLIYNSMCSSG